METAPRTLKNLRQLLRPQLPKEWLESDGVYGWLLVARVLLPLFALIYFMPSLVARFGYGVLLLAAPVLGVLIYKIQFVLHETAHDTLFANSELNTAVGTACGWLTGSHFLSYRHIHWNHHNRNGEASDPQFPDYLGDRTLSRSGFWVFLLSPLVGGRVPAYLRRELRTLFVRREIPIENLGAAAAPSGRPSPPITLSWVAQTACVQSMIAAVITRFFRMPALLLLYPFGATCVALFLSRIRTIAEHQRMAGLSSGDFTRSHAPHWLDALVLYDANFNLHFEHHIFPQMPARHLSKLHARFRDEIHDGGTLGKSMLATVLERFRECPRPEKEG